VAQGAIFIGWGQPFPGYRQKALKVFNDAMEFWKRLQKQGEIDSFEVVFLSPHGGDLVGFNLIRGDREKLARLQMNPEYESLNQRADLCCRNFGAINALVGDEIQRSLGEFTKHLAELN